MKTRPDFTDPSERYLFLCSDLLLIAQVYRDKQKFCLLDDNIISARESLQKLLNYVTYKMCFSNTFTVAIS